MELVEQDQLPGLGDFFLRIVRAEQERRAGHGFRGAHQGLGTAVHALDPLVGGRDALVVFQVHLVVPDRDAVRVFFERVIQIVGAGGFGVSQLRERHLVFDFLGQRAVAAVAGAVENRHHRHHLFGQQRLDLVRRGQVVGDQAGARLEQVAGLAVFAEERPAVDHAQVAEHVVLAAVRLNLAGGEERGGAADPGGDVREYLAAVRGLPVEKVERENVVAVPGGLGRVHIFFPALGRELR